MCIDKMNTSHVLILLLSDDIIKIKVFVVFPLLCVKRLNKAGTGGNKANLKQQYVCQC